MSADVGAEVVDDFVGGYAVALEDVHLSGCARGGATVGPHHEQQYIVVHVARVCRQVRRRVRYQLQRERLHQFLKHSSLLIIQQ